MKKYDISTLPKGYKGAVDRLGNFYLFGSVMLLEACHNEKFAELTLNVLNQDPRLIFEAKKKELQHPEYYQFRGREYDFKSLAIDFLGLCAFTIYGKEIGNYAAIEVPNPNINGMMITKEQKNTLIKLVSINQCCIESLRPIFHTEYSDTQISYVKK